MARQRFRQPKPIVASALCLFLVSSFFRQWAALFRTLEVRAHVSYQLKCMSAPNTCAVLCSSSWCIVQTLRQTAVHRNVYWSVLRFGRAHLAVMSCSLLVATTGELWHIIPVGASLLEISMPKSPPPRISGSYRNRSAILISNPLHNVAYKGKEKMLTYYHTPKTGTSPYVSKILTLWEGVEKLNITILHDRDMKCALSPRYMNTIRLKSMRRGTGGFYISALPKSQHHAASMAPNCTETRRSSFIVYDSFNQNRSSDILFLKRWALIMSSSPSDKDPWWFDSQVSNCRPEVYPFMHDIEAPDCTHCPTASIDRWSCLAGTSGVYSITLTSLCLRVVLGAATSLFICFMSASIKRLRLKSGRRLSDGASKVEFIIIKSIAIYLLAFVSIGPFEVNSNVNNLFGGMSVKTTERTFKYREISAFLLSVGYSLQIKVLSRNSGTFENRNSYQRSDS